MMQSESQSSDEAEQPPLKEVRFEYTPLLPEILQHIQASLLVTTYQAGKLLVLGVHQGKMVISFLDYDQPMGLAVEANKLAIGTRRQMHFLVAAHETLKGGPSEFDGCYVPRASAYTGSIHGHDLAWGREGLWVVNTLFSCLCTLHDQYSFVPRWRPPFISQLIDQDRCHLNGMAMENGMPRYVTALAETDTAAGWRPSKATSGVVLEVPSGEVLCRGLSMPHSPRLYQDRLWTLNSGHGSLGFIDRTTGRFEEVEAMPGYTRGLAFYGQFAFVGLSKIRETAVFGGIPIAENRESLRCGVGVVDLVSGQTVAVFQFHSGVSEIFAVDVLPGIMNPMIAGASVDQREQDVWIVPAPNMPTPKQEKTWPLFAGPSQTVSSSTDRSDFDGNELHAFAMHLHQQGRLAEAAVAFGQILERSPSAIAWVNFGNLQQDLLNQDKAIECYRMAVGLDDRCVPALQNLGYLLFNRGEPSQAMDCYERLLTIDDSPMNQLLASCVLPVVYESKSEVDTWRRNQVARLKVMAQKSIHVDAARQLIPTAFFWAYQGENDRELMELRGKLVSTVTRKVDADTALSKLKERMARGGNRKIRVGWISAYFRNHTIGRLNVGRIERLDRNLSEVHVLYAGREYDSMAERFRQAADRYLQIERDVAHAKRQIQELDLDVLIFADVGMDALCSTLAHHRLAPYQVATWGHPDTTGSYCMDAFLSSQWLEVEAAQSHYSERLVLLPNLGTYYDRPMVEGSKRTRLHWGLSDTSTLYLCPQTLFKFHPDFDSCLGAILEGDPSGVLVLIDGRVPAWTDSLRKRWKRTLGSASGRVVFLPPQGHPDFLQLLAEADVVLDTMHFGGGNTSYEAFAMGQPIVTLPGEFLRSRITLAMYRKMGLEDFVAQSPEQYVEMALKLGCDREFRKEARRQIVDRSRVLFEDVAEVHAIDNWLRSLI